MDRPNEPLGNLDEETGYDQSSVQARTERELALRMVTSRALVDAGFYEQLRENPRAAIEKLHVSLPEEDISRFERVDWDAIDAHVKALREAIGFGSAHMMRGAW